MPQLREASKPLRSAISITSQKLLKSRREAFVDGVECQFNLNSSRQKIRTRVALSRDSPKQSARPKEFC